MTRSVIDPARSTAASLEALREALAAAQGAPDVGDPLGAVLAPDEDEDADIATPRATAASGLESALKSRREWHRARREGNGDALCRALIDMCAWHEHPALRDRVLALQTDGLVLLAANPEGEPSAGDVGEIEDGYQAIKPREDDAEAIAAALGMTIEEARAFGLVGTLDRVAVDEEEPVGIQSVGRVAGYPRAGIREEEEDLETLFRREAMTMATRTLPQALQRFWGAQQSVDLMLSVRRGFHTLKGDARVTAQGASAELSEELEGLAILSEAGEDIIDYLLGEDYDVGRPAPPLPPGAFSLLNETANAIAHRLEARGPLENEPAVLRRLEAMQRKAAALSGTPLDEASLAAKLPAAAPKRPAPVRPAVPRPSSHGASHSLLPTFLEEADRLMPDLHRALSLLTGDASDEGALVRARVKLHTLKGGAALIGDEASDIQQIAHAAEDLFELIEDFQLRGEMSEVPRAVLDGVLDAEDALQALLDQLRRQTQTGRLQTTTRLLPVAPQHLVASLNLIAEAVRRGDIGDTVAKEEAIESALGDPMDGLSTTSSPAVPTAPAAPTQIGTLALRHTVPSPLTGLTAIVPAGLRTVSFQDLVEHDGPMDVRSRTAVFDRARVIEDRARMATGAFTLFTCVQEISNYEREREHYQSLVGDQGHIYVFGRLDITPSPVDHITIVPLDAGDALLAERVVILDAVNAPAAFLAYDAASDPLQAGRRFHSIYTEDATLVREAAGRIRAALQLDAGLLSARRAALTMRDQQSAVVRGQAAAARRPDRKRAVQGVAYDREENVALALAALEDLSVTRDALQELMSRMNSQSVESRRSGRRLRTLVERVGTELSGLRSELVRTTRRAGDWDLLEKEEYTTVDVLLMQLDEALADLEESDTNLRRDLGEAEAQVEVQSDSELRAQRALLNMSMIPLSQIEDRLDHAVRSQSRRLGKQVSFSLEGGELLLDNRIAQSLFEPMIHLINNALDHGIEEKPGERSAAGKPAEGRLVVRGRANGDGVAIEVSDDGRGMDPERLAAMAVSRGIVSAQEAAAMTIQERLALIWRPGFSTAKSLTTVSGRGMGMKSVQDDINSLQGRVEIQSEVGKGTTFVILLPRSLAMMRVMVLREGKDLLAVPITQLVGTHPVPYAAVTRAGMVLRLGHRELTVYGAHLGAGPAGDGESGQGLLIEAAGRSGGVLVDEVIGSQYLPVRAAPSFLRRACGLLGYAVGGAGRILPILDLPTLIDRSAASQPAANAATVERRAYTVLVVDDSQTMRRALRDTLNKAGFQVREAADGREALTTCSRAMPDLITLDMEMPGMDGLEALSALRLLPDGGASVPVFMITSRQQARHRAAALAAGVTRYFTKPYDAEELIGAAHLVLAEGMQQQNEVAS